MINTVKPIKPHYHLTTLILFWCSLIVVSALYLTIPLLTVFEDVFQVSSSDAAWAGSAFSFAFAGGGLLFGGLSDRYGRKKMMIAGLCLLTASTPFIGIVHEFHWLIILRVIQGLAASMFPPAVLAYAMEMFPANKKVTILGFISTAFLMASIVGQIYSSTVEMALSWENVFYILGIVYFVSLFLIALGIPKDITQKPEGDFFSPLKRIGGIFKKKSLPFCYIISSTLFISLVGFFSTLGSYLSSAHFGLSHQEILWVRAAGIIGMFLSPFDGKLVAKFGVKNVLWCGLIMAGIGLGLVGVSENLALLIPTSIIFTAGIAMALPALISLIGTLAGELRASALSFHMFMLFIGASLGPIISVYLIDTQGHRSTFEVLAGLLLISTVVPLFIRLERKESITPINQRNQTTS
ncbi:MFS transporter [Paenibacillus glycanilyticus]|uniref:MFS transporter n=1 Tax=Paenibacillus glycanilyticus TaxID=126569 RepID=A0ABQ6NQV9_9BACL|nr:MFS transporter [Paenibacillus glycanilyticus]GMK47178.1 MFS transporter [Paenibacillus glycanilyticus]